MKKINEPSREIPITNETSVLVVGGGAAGLSAAIAARRMGCDVTLIEKYGFLGGTLTSVTLGSFCGIFTVTEDSIKPVVKGFQEEIIERLKMYNGVSEAKRWLKTASVPYDTTSFKRVADELVEEAGVQILYHTLAVSVIKEHNQVKGVIIENKNGRSAIMADVIIDASGDGDIISMAGGEYSVGDNGITQFPSSMFRMVNVNTEKLSSLSREEVTEYFQKAVNDGYPLPRVAGGIHLNPIDHVVHLNVTKVSNEGEVPINPLDTSQLTYAEMEGRKQVFLYERVLQKYVPGFEKARVIDIGPSIGIREARLIKGDYTLTSDDVLSCRKFEDAIACGAWPVEMHDSGNKTRWVWIEPGNFYTIPYQSLIPARLENVLMAGRNISATHEAQASVRVSAICMAMGQAAGIAAYLALSQENQVRHISVEKLQKLLLDNNAFLP
ncbi:FAD-dependent oxidoreductase [Peribacillus cavernae]|nr:FAD-dependent oxidoreductase [Peribacillus cavernae]MDQ0218117.1 ribulose 1,5-bisphosphate synthetase/thiazole synthase [Peribacillus cavernae]